MPLSEMLLPEFDHEMANTRKALERIPDTGLQWKPHQKSWSMGELATHLANIPSWTPLLMSTETFDLAPVEGKAPESPAPIASAKEAVERFDQNVAVARQAISQASDEQLLEKWTLLKGGETVFSLPRMAVYRNMLMNHLIHHRAQLGVYLRLNDIPVPAIYGPSADEEM
ncbi:MAG: DUF664 domain-containing protein [Calditrichaeota bacterium]|nr:MAG: DUF664 domain-containing protein [Calditrichota bacterium]